jgi:hypothetical protein
MLSAFFVKNQKLQLGILPMLLPVIFPLTIVVVILLLKPVLAKEGFTLTGSDLI